MKALSCTFAALAILLSDVMCAAVAFNYCDMLWGIRYASYSAPASTAFLLVIPYAAANAGMQPKHFIAAIFISLPFPTLLTCAAGSFILEGNWFFTVLTGIVLFSFVGILFFNRTKFIAWAHEMKNKRTKKAEA